MELITAVTGAAAGLGWSVAGCLLERGRAVALVDREAGALEATGGEFAARFGRVVPTVVADLSTRAGIDGAADELLALGDLGGLVNNAGGWLPGEQYPAAVPDDWLSALTLNLIAPMLLTQRLWPELAGNRGAVVSIGSSGGLGDMSYGSPEYGAAKAGVRRFTASLGGRTDVRVMAVVPGWIGLERAMVEWAELTPDQQWRTDPPIPPEDLAGMVADLLETGQAGEVVTILKPQEYHSTRVVQR